MKVFISYAFADRDTMNTLRNSLQNKGIDVYTAEHHLQLGKPLSVKIQNAIRNSEAVIALVTEGESSPSVNQEVGYALSSNIPVIPLVEEGARVGFMIGDVEQMRFNKSTVHRACEKVANYVVKEIGQEREEQETEREKEAIFYDESIKIDPEEYEGYGLDLEEDDRITGRVASDLPVDVYIMNSKNFEYFEDDGDFDYEDGSEGTTRFSISFTCPKKGKWFLVVDNLNDDEVDVDVLVKLA